MNLRQEQRLWKLGYRFITGVDEVGRGALAGPVAAAAVILLRQPKSKIPTSLKLRGASKSQKSKFRNLNLLKIKDSKHLTPIQREKFYQMLINHPRIIWSVAKISEKEIDRSGIDKAVWRAMEKAVLKLKPRPDFLLIDGNRFHSHKLPATTYKLIIRGDEKVFSIAAASVIAKVTRDHLMIKLAKKYPQYGLEKHKGYGTKEHFAAIKKYGIRGIHRRSFLAGPNKP